MKQYTSVKESYPDAIVLFRLGDFYEMFGEDAEKASAILQIALTSRDKSKDNPLPMCGVPYFASETYISRLIKAGFKVAVCEQMEDPKETKGIVAREVVRVITPNTHTPDNPKENTFIMSIFPAGRKHGVAAADISTGQFIVFETAENIEDEASSFEPKEIIPSTSLRTSITRRPFPAITRHSATTGRSTMQMRTRRSQNISACHPLTGLAAADLPPAYQPQGRSLNISRPLSRKILISEGSQPSGRQRTCSSMLRRSAISN
jgi:DNA mismatch repair ATPase MutS